jgi:hypothetical protein
VALAIRFAQRNAEKLISACSAVGSGIHHFATNYQTFIGKSVAHLGWCSRRVCPLRLSRIDMPAKKENEFFRRWKRRPAGATQLSRREEITRRDFFFLARTPFALSRRALPFFHSLIRTRGPRRSGGTGRLHTTALSAI